MSQTFRTAEGGRIDRNQPLTFSFDEHTYSGFHGDTLASGLLANGVHLLGRSFKYHRPRGLLATGPEEPNALVSINGGARHTPNLRASEVELYQGLEAISQNRFPSLQFDVGAVNGLLSPLIGAGFYYKTFMGPARAWTKLYEPLIRRAAGLGQAPRLPDPDHYTQRYGFCDVLVVGGGAAGLAAAQGAAAAGAKLVLADEQAEMGGGLLAEPGVTIDEIEASAWLARTVRALADNPAVTVLPRTSVFGYFAQNFLGAAERLTDHLAKPDPAMPRERLWKIRAKQVVLATGAIERPLVFPDNDRPGIMLAGAARQLVNRYGVRPGTRALVFTADDSAYAAASDLAAAGVQVVAIVDLRQDAGEAALAAARRAGTPVLMRSVVMGTSGHLRVASARIGTIRADGSVVPWETIGCDLIAMSGGWTPAVHLFSQSRGRLRFDEARQIYLPGQSKQAERSAGAAAGRFGIAAALAEGFAAGTEAAKAAGLERTPRRRTREISGEIVPDGGFQGLVPHDQPPEAVKAFVDFQNDVTARDIALAVREGFHSIEHVKRYTTNGMATDQGKTSNMNALAIAAEALGRPIPEVGLTTFRMPYTPVTFGSFAGHARGELFDPVRTTPIHDWALAHGGVFEDVGQWKRARYFPRIGEDERSALARECRAVRESVGLFDASTLGKIEVVGPDAAAFLNRMYTGDFSKLQPGRCRYALMLNEAGFVMDDGIVACLSPDRFHVTTTTGGAAAVLHQMEDYLQTEFTDLKVWLTSITEHWSVIAVQGKASRAMLEPLVEGIDLSALAMPHMSLREGAICGVPVRLFRVSFTGELGFEVNVPSGFGRQVWESLWTAGQKHEAVAYGTDTMHVLRAEKGYIIVGQETDGTVTPADLGLAIGKTKPDFVGKRSLIRPDMLKPDRKQLVGLLTDNSATVPEEGAQVVSIADPPPGTPALGHVTSAYWSEALQRSIALALVSGGRSRLGETLYLPMPAGSVPARVVPSVFLDPEGKRLDV